MLYYAMIYACNEYCGGGHGGQRGAYSALAEI